MCASDILPLSLVVWSWMSRTNDTGTFFELKYAHAEDEHYGDICALYSISISWIHHWNVYRIGHCQSFASWNDSIRDFIDIFVIIPWHYPKIHTLFFSATIRCQSSINEHIESGDAVYAMKCFWVNTWTSGDEEGGGLSISSFNWNSILYEFWRWNFRFCWGLWVLGHLCFWYWMNAN